MKKLKKIIALTMTLAMILALGVGLTAMADDDPPIGSITFISDPRTEATDYYAFQIFKLSWNEAADAFTYTLHIPKYAAIKDLADDYLDLTEEARTDAVAREFAADVWEIIKDYEADVSGKASNAAWEDMELGYYLISSTGPNADGNAQVTASVSLTTNAPYARIIPKVDLPTINKEITTSGATRNESLDPGNRRGNNVINRTIGSEVEFTITSTVPDMFAFESYTFIVKDTMSKGLTYKAGSMVVKVGTKTLIEGTTGDDTYGLTVTGTDPTLITVTFNNFIKHTKDDAIEIKYVATLNAGAVIREPGNPNRVLLSYSNNPYGTSTGDTAPSEVIVYTYDLGILKYTKTSFDDAVPVTLSGTGGNAFARPDAFFLLYDAKTDGNVIPVVEVNPPVEAGVATYRLAVGAEAGVEMESPVGGRIRIIGLLPGTEYWVEETQEPDGYNPLIGRRSITVDADGLQTLEVENNTGSALPGVGGIGRTIFIIVGLSVMTGSIVLLAVRRKISRSAV